MKKLSLIIFGVSTAIAINACVLKPQKIERGGKRIFSGELQMYSLREDVMKLNPFESSPTPVFDYLKYSNIDEKSGENVGESSYSIDEISNQYTKSTVYHKPSDDGGSSSMYRTLGKIYDFFFLTPLAPNVTRIPGTPVLKTTSIGIGGLFIVSGHSQMVSVSRAYTSPHFLFKMEGVSLSNYTGRLFPLEVGNYVEFDMKIRVKNTPGGRSIADAVQSRHFRYEVIGKENNYKTPDGEIFDSEIFVIRELELDSETQKSLIQEIRYSPKLAWFVERTVVSGGERGMSVKLNDWRPRGIEKISSSKALRQTK